MKTARFYKNIIDQVLEAQIKLGYAKETIRLFYPLSSLRAYLSYNFKDLMEFIEKISYESIPEAFPKPFFYEVIQNRLEVRIVPENTEFIHLHYPEEPFLTAIVNLFAKHHPSMDDIEELFASFSRDYTVEKVSEETGFDFSVHFADSSIDEYYYCFKEEMNHMIYHRFMREDYLLLLQD